MIRSLIRTTLLSAAFVLAASVAHAAPSSPAEVEGNKMEKKGNVEEKAANAEKAKGAQMEKKGKAMEDAGDKNDNPRQGYRAAKGPLSIQGHDPTTDILFRNIRIAELPK